MSLLLDQFPNIRKFALAVAIQYAIFEKGISEQSYLDHCEKSLQDSDFNHSGYFNELNNWLGTLHNEDLNGLSGGDLTRVLTIGRSCTAWSDVHQLCVYEPVKEGFLSILHEDDEPVTFEYISLDSQVSNLQGFRILLDIAFSSPMQFPEGMEFAVELLDHSDFSLKERDNALVMEVTCSHLGFTEGKVQWYFIHKHLSDILKYPTDHVASLIVEGNIPPGGEAFMLPGRTVLLVVTKVYPQTI